MPGALPPRRSLRGSKLQRSQAADLPVKQTMPVEFVMNLRRGTVEKHKPDPLSSEGR